MKRESRILILEDSPHDAELAVNELRAARLYFQHRRVETRGEFIQALETFDPDVILSAYSLAEFNGLDALALVRRRSRDIPFILCTGESNEETAVECMKQGAADYLLKSSLKRLPTAVLNAIERHEYRKAEETASAALRESEYQLQQAQKMEAIGTLTGGVAHDFNNLLMAILGNTQLALRKIASDHPVHPRLLEIEKAASRAAELTRKLLAYSRRQRLDRRGIDLNEHISEITRLLRRVIGVNVKIVGNYDPTIPAVFADPAQVEQVIMNLSINARDAMPEGGELRIETSYVELDEDYCALYPYVRPGGFVRIEVSDSGTGMDASTLEHIFEPFFTTKEQGKGTGLGLSTAYGIIKQHEGHIHVNSEPGKGTTFEVFFPVDQGTVVEKDAPPLHAHSPEGSETILVAEDEESLRILVRDVLQEIGYQVLLASDGDEAIDIFSQNRDQIDLLLFDAVMPRTGGLEAYERIREIAADVPLILMTGYSTETVQSRFIKPDRSADDYGAVVIRKPYEIQALGQKVREVLDRSRIVGPTTGNPLEDSGMHSQQ